MTPNAAIPQSQFIITASGRRMYPMAPTVDMVHLNDIASALSKMARWTGHTLGDMPYTVAQHAVMVSYAVSSEFALEALHHDSSEAYLIDVARPLKYTKGFKEVYMPAEKALTEVIYRALGIPYPGEMSAAVHEADGRMLATEARDIMPIPVGGWDEELRKLVPYRWSIGIEDDPGISTGIWSAKLAREMFLTTHWSHMERFSLRNGLGLEKPRG